MSEPSDPIDHLKKTFDTALAKLKVGMDRGPGDHVILTSEEATILYRLLTERRT